MINLNRRELLTITGVSLLPAMSGNGQAKPGIRTDRFGERDTFFVLQTCPIAGFQFYEGEHVWNRLHDGAALHLKREADNPYDDRAVGVWWYRSKLGYVPRRDNAAVCQLLDRRIPLHARLVARRQSSDPWQRLEMAILLDPKTMAAPPATNYLPADPRQPW